LVAAILALVAQENALQRCERHSQSESDDGDLKGQQGVRFKCSGNSKESHEKGRGRQHEQRQASEAEEHGFCGRRGPADRLLPPTRS
jgi:hypothetical protein